MQIQSSQAEIFEGLCYLKKLVDCYVRCSIEAFSTQLFFLHEEERGLRNYACSKEESVLWALARRGMLIASGHAEENSPLADLWFQKYT